MNRLVENILHRLLPPDERDAILGDLAEERVRAGRTDWWYFRESIALLLHGFGRNVMRNLGLNVLALVLFWLVAFALVRLTSGLLLASVAPAIASAIGVLIALRLRAVVAAVILGGQVAFALSELGIHLATGVVVRGGPVHLAVMLAGTLGVVFGLLLTRARALRAA